MNEFVSFLHSLSYFLICSQERSPLLVHLLSFERWGKVYITTSLFGTMLSLVSLSASSLYPSLGSGKSRSVAVIAGC